ncbi:MULTISPECIES: enoyl-CoA hydratase/isomerase family protein [Streptomyces]|uniref:Enoyl-CoA hydratase/isomerase family protein n=1 Tax=Streptomyces siderophoricus TaxID=2802281 RepID=A0ABS1N213_9ACTN|nr:enoyl-CoA hydratase/isomerase family protein [Streptomyces sp. 9-7]MBL1093985.1 enoyl-CoA hydratase/isomerase family protein [Streptomyces sp. 9-7]
MTGTGAVGVQRDGALATVRIGSGHRANALGTRDWQALSALLDRLGEDRSLRAVVLSGRGTAAFSAGSDMREWLSADPTDIDASFSAMEAALTAVERLPVPVIAEVRGIAAGAGCQLACACDLRIVASDAELGMPIARWGILVPPSFAARIATLTGPATARDLLLTGRLVDGEEAARIGLATATAPEPKLASTTAAVIASITAHPPSAVRAAKQSVNTLLAPTRDRLRQLPSSPAADYASLQHTLSAFLTRSLTTGT